MKKILICLIFGILFSLTFVSAFEFDNIKSYNSKTKTITIINSFGFGKDLVEFKLIKNTDHCGGDIECYAIIKTTLYEKYTNPFSEVVFEDLKNGRKLKDLNYQILINKSGEYENYSFKEELNGEFYLKIIGDKRAKEIIDWIPTLYGFVIKEWAVWGAQVTYDDFNDNFINYTLWENVTTTGSISESGGQLKLDAGDNNEFTIKSNSTGEMPNINAIENITIRAILHYKCEDTTCTSEIHVFGTIIKSFGGSGPGFAEATNDSVWTIIRNGTNFEYYASGSHEGTITNPTSNEIKFKAFSSGAGPWKNADTDIEYVYYTLGDTALNISLNLPTDETKQMNNTVIFNISAEVFANELSNISLYINEIFNDTNIVTGTLNETNFTKTLVRGNYNWSAYVCDNENNCKFSDTFDLVVGKWEENSQNYSINATEGNIETFRINITYDNSFYSSILGNLIYNGTSYSGTSFDSGNTITFTTGIAIPNINADINFPFYWEIVLIDGTPEFFNSTFHNQTVFHVNIDNCSTNTNVIFNFTLVDEEDQDFISANNSIEILVNTYSTDRSVLILNYSESFNKSSIAICTNINLSNFASAYSLDSTLKYSAQDHEIEYYNIVNYSLNNQSGIQNIFLFDLLTADSTEFQLTFTDSNFLPVEDALVFINRQYVGENIFKTVELPKTDSNGQTILHLVKNDIIYNIQIIKDGIVIGNFENMIAFCDDVIIGDCKITLSAAESGEAIFSYNDALGITYTGPTYNNITRIITFNFLTTDGSVKTVLMNATRNDIFGNSSICSTTITSSGGILSCAVPSHIDDSIIIVKVFVNGQETVKDYIILSDFNYGQAGYFIFFIFMLSFILMFSKSKSIMLIGIIVGFIAGISLGLISGRLVGIGASGIWLVVVIVLMIWKLNKERSN